MTNQTISFEKSIAASDLNSALYKFRKGIPKGFAIVSFQLNKEYDEDDFEANTEIYNLKLLIAKIDINNRVDNY